MLIGTGLNSSGAAATLFSKLFTVLNTPVGVTGRSIIEFRIVWVAVFLWRSDAVQGKGEVLTEIKWLLTESAKSLPFTLLPLVGNSRSGVPHFCLFVYSLTTSQTFLLYHCIAEHLSAWYLSLASLLTKA